jgi:tetratricopeptide (TPR) repeat protein
MKKMCISRTSVLILFFIFFGITLFAQTDVELADVYFQKGECEKVTNLYQKILRKDFNKVYLRRYVQCVIKTKGFDDADKFMKRQAKSDERFGVFYTLYAGRILDQINKPEQATLKYEEVLAQLKNDLEQYKEIADEFKDFGNVDMGIATLLKARSAANNVTLFKMELAQLYGQKGATEAMIEEFLGLGLAYQNKEFIQNYLQDFLKEEKEQVIYEKILYEKIQRQPNEPFYAEMLIWFFVQRKQFNKAYIQERALDKRLKQGGAKLYDLGSLALQNKDYNTAIKCYEYVMTEYKTGPMYPFAKRMMINSKEEQVKNTFPIERAAVQQLVTDYKTFMNEVGHGMSAMESLRSMGLLYAFYLNEKDSATLVLEQALKMGRNETDFMDKCKLDLGDIYLLKNEPWESTLLYSQVEKSQKETLLGYEAKLKNARLNYYKGDFTLAKEILDILKMATTREIANDAGFLSLLIQDNTGLDTSEEAMRQYAAIDLMLYQNKVQEALDSLDKMYKKYQSHPLQDEILWLKAKTYAKMGNDTKVIENLSIIVEKYNYDILADDAIFMLAELYQNRLKDKNKAMDYYQMILEKYPASVYGSEARKRYRSMRGDSL